MRSSKVLWFKKRAMCRLSKFSFFLESLSRSLFGKCIFFLDCGFVLSICAKSSMGVYSSRPTFLYNSSFNNLLFGRSKEKKEDTQSTRVLTSKLVGKWLSANRQLFDHIDPGFLPWFLFLVLFFSGWWSRWAFRNLPMERRSWERTTQLENFWEGALGRRALWCSTLFGEASRHMWGGSRPGSHEKTHKKWNQVPCWNM